MTIRELEQLITTYGKDILSFCVHLSGNVSDGEELYQEVFFKAMNKLPFIQINQNPKSYLLGMAIKIFYAEKRKMVRRNDLVPTLVYDDAIENETACMEDCFVEQENKMIVQKAVHELPEKYRTVILLFYMEELSLQEIARLLHIPKGTVASRLHKAKNILRDRLEDYYGEI